MLTLAKLTRPKTHRALKRERLFDALDAARERPLVWVTSPPGAGKTTLLSSYLEQRRLRSLWYQIDPGDEDVGAFFYYLAQAAPGSKRDAPLPQFLPEHRADLPAFCRLFMRALFSRSSAPTVIAFDNYHELASDASLHGLVGLMVAEVPEGCSLVVISRTQPPRELASLQMNGRMTVIDWSVLRLSLEETRALAATQSILDESSVSRLHADTDGWAAGIALMLSRSGPLGAARPDVHPGHVDAMFGQFASQLLKETSPALQEFLVCTSLLPTMTAEQAARLSGRHDSNEVLEDLHRSGLFTNRRNTRPPVYQYHDLFRAFLIARLEQSKPADELAQLRRAAGRILEESGLHDHAIRLYLALGDWGNAQRALMAGAPSLLAQGRSESLCDWVRALPDEHAASPWMRFWFGAALARLIPTQARAPLAEAWRSLPPGREVALRRLICATTIFTFALEYSDFSPLDHWGASLLELLEADEPFEQVTLELHVYTACLFALGQRMPRPLEMQRCLARTMELIDDAAVPADLAAVSLGFALVQHFSVGTLREGHAVARRLRDLVEHRGLTPLAEAMSWVQLGHMALRTGEGDVARQALSRGISVATENALAMPMLRVFSNLGLAFEALQRGDLTQAELHRHAIEEATAPERKTDRVAVLRIHYWTACHRDQWDLALLLAEKQRLLARECGLFVVMFECDVLLAYTFAHLGRAEEMDVALKDVEHLIRGTAFAHFEYHCELARAWCALRRGDLERGRRHLDAGLAGSVADEGKFMLRMQPALLPGLLAAALHLGIQRGYALQLIEQMRVPAPAAPAEEWPWPIRIYTLGRFEVQRRGRPLEFSRKAPRKTLALLKAIIALGGRNVREQRVLDIFWPDEDGDVAVRSLTAALHRLRSLLEVDDAVVQQGGTLTLNPAFVWVDALAFDALVAGEGAPDAGALLKLYRGAFLREDEGEPWTVTLRERLQNRFIHALGAETARLERDGHYERAIECYLRGLDADPVIESFYQGLMRCHARAGRRSEAVAAYRRLKHILSVTLSLKPSAATERLYQSLRLDPG